MMNPIECFMLDPTDEAVRFLRRYTVGKDVPLCPLSPGDHSYHNAMVGIEPTALIRVMDGDRSCVRIEPMDWPHDDPRWPKACGCGYEFRPDDNWQLFYEPVYRTADGRKFSTHASDHEAFGGVPRAPAGAMWFADWMPHTKGPDGRCLIVRCPARPDGTGVCDWMVDGPSTNGDGWTRTGTPPKVTAHPSIFVHAPSGFHGWLRDGVLVSC